MADTKISALTELAGATVATGDWIPIVDTTATATKKLDAGELGDVPALVAAFAPLTETFNEVAATGATENIDMDKPFQRLTMDEACTFSFSNKAGVNEIRTSVVYIDGAFTPTFHADADFGDTGAPTYSDGSLFVFTSFDNETKVIAGIVATGGFTP